MNSKKSKTLKVDCLADALLTKIYANVAFIFGLCLEKASKPLKGFFDSFYLVSTFDHI